MPLPPEFLKKGGGDAPADDKAPPFGKKEDKPKTDEKSAAKPKEDGADIGKQVENVLDEAEKAGEIEPLNALVAEQGLDCTGRELFKYAQDDDRTAGKKASEVADMLRNEPDLLDDIVALKHKDNPPEKGPSFEDVMRDTKKKDAPADDDFA